MKYKILTTFLGSQDGSFTETFEAGTEREISDYLAQCAPKGSIGPISAPEVKNKAISTSGKSKKAAK